MKKITIRLMGGLGNQLFQAAFGVELQQRLGAEVVYDVISGFTRDPFARHFELSKYQGDFKPASCSDVPFSVTVRPPWHRLFRIYWNSPLAVNGRVVHEKTPLRYDDDVLKRISQNNLSYVYGYWQNQRYFSARREILKFRFALKKVSDSYSRCLESIESRPTLGIHIRRRWGAAANGGTYHAAEKNHALCDRDYFSRALAAMTSITAWEQVLIFTDDPDWAKANISCKEPTFHISSSNCVSANEEMALLSHCACRIISNSTFGWWGAWLGDGGHVIAPARWFNAREENGSDICPASWILLTN